MRPRARCCLKRLIFFRPRNLDQSNSRPDQTAQLFVRTPQPLPPKKGSAFLGTLGRIAFYIPAKIKGPNPYIDEYVREDAAHPLASKKSGWRASNPQANSLPIISKTKSNSNSKANPIPHPPSPTKCLQSAMAVGASCHPKTIASRTVLSLSHAT